MTPSGPELRFSGTLVHPSNPASWTVVAVPGSKKAFGTGNAVKAHGTIDGHPFTATLMPDGQGDHMLPVNGALRKTIGKHVGDVVDVLLTHSND